MTPTPNDVLQAFDDVEWLCSNCHLKIHLNQARICIICCPPEVGERSSAVLVLYDIPKAEQLLICAHCAIESKHRYHLTTLYLPVKFRSFAIRRGNELLKIIKHGASSSKERDTIQDAIGMLKETSITESTWPKCQEQWKAAEAAVSGLVAANKKINEHLAAMDRITQQIEQENAKKQDFLARLTCIISGVPMDTIGSEEAENLPDQFSHPSSPSMTHSDTDSGSVVSLMKRYDYVEDLSSLY